MDTVGEVGRVERRVHVDQSDSIPGRAAGCNKVGNPVVEVVRAELKVIVAVIPRNDFGNDHPGSAVNRLDLVEDLTNLDGRRARVLALADVIGADVQQYDIG